MQTSQRLHGVDKVCVVRDSRLEDGVDLGFPVCRTCGVQYPEGVDLARCPICSDERQYVGWSGQRWTTLGELAADGHRGVLTEEEPGLLGIGDRKSTRLNSSHLRTSRMPSSA